MSKINKKDLIIQISKKTEINQEIVKKIFDELTNSIEEGVIANNTINISGFGVFSLIERRERKGIHPKTKRIITIEATKSVKFRFSKIFKEKVKNS